MSAGAESGGRLKDVFRSVLESQIGTGEMKEQRKKIVTQMDVEALHQLDQIRNQYKDNTEFCVTLVEVICKYLELAAKNYFIILAYKKLDTAPNGALTAIRALLLAEFNRQLDKAEILARGVKD